MNIKNFKKADNPKQPNLIAEFTLETDKFIINGCRVLKGKNGWFPVVSSCRLEENWVPVIQFVNPNHQKAFNEQMKQAVSDYISKHNLYQEENKEDFTEEIPF